MNTIEEIIAYIREKIYNNGVQKITGNYLQDVLVNVADALEQIHTDDIGRVEGLIAAVDAAKAALHGSSSEDFAAKALHAFSIITDSIISGQIVSGETVYADKITMHNPGNNAMTDLVPGGQPEDIEVYMPSKAGTLALLADVDEIVPETDKVVSDYIVMPLTNTIVRQFLEIPLYKGHAYHFAIRPNGYTVGSGNYSFVVNLYSDYEHTTEVATPLSMSRADYTGQELIEFDYVAEADSAVIRYYIAQAGNAGTGVQYTITEKGRVLDFAKPALLSSVGTVSLPVTLEQGSMLVSGYKESPNISTSRVRTVNLVKVYGRTRFSVPAGFQFSLFWYNANDYGTKAGQTSSYQDGPFTLDWRGYVGCVIRRSNNTSVLPHEVSLGIQALSLAELIDALKEKTVKNYGATGDGVTDDAAAITSALAAGGVVRFPAGTYLVKSPIPIKSNTEIVFDPGATVLRGANIKALFYADYNANTTAYNGEHDITIRGGVLDMGTGFSQGGFPLGLIHARNVKVHDVTFKHSNAGYHCIDICGVRNVEVRGCRFEDILTNIVYGECVQIDDTLNYTHFPILDLDGDYPCWDGTPCENVEICGCRFNVNDYSPAIGNHNGGAHKYIDIHDNLIIGTGSASNTRGAIAFGKHATSGVNITSLVNIHDNIVENFAIGFQVETEGLFVVKGNIFSSIATLKTAESNGTFDNNYTNA